MITNICGAEATVVSWERCEKSVVFTPFPDWEVVLARETSEPAIAKGVSVFDGFYERVHRSMTVVGESAVSECT